MQSVIQTEFIHTLKMCTFYFMRISHIFFSFLGVLNSDIFSLEMLRWFLVCVICNLSSFHSFINKICIMIEHVHPIFVLI